jgi:hypothetical protein
LFHLLPRKIKGNQKEKKKRILNMLSRKESPNLEKWENGYRYWNFETLKLEKDGRVSSLEVCVPCLLFDICIFFRFLICLELFVLKINLVVLNLNFIHVANR